MASAQAATEELVYQAIGKFIFAFSQLEYMLKEHVASEAGVKDEHFIAIMTHDFALLCTIASDVLGKTCKHEEEKEELRAIISDCRKVNDMRVKVVHGLWVPFMDGGRVWHVSRNSLKPSMSVEQAKELERYSQLANQLLKRVEDFMWGGDT
jgi:hypothetical protein